MPPTLEDAHDTLQAAHAALGAPPSAGEVAQWMEAMYAVFRAGTADGGACPSELHAHAQRTAPVMRETFAQQLRYLSKLEATLFDLDRHEDWARGCHMRSTVEVVRTLYADLCGDEPPFTAPADTDHVDDLIRDLAERFGYLRETDVPPEIPPAHWWWWAPLPPPDAHPVD
jgi:hypothetical protein